jgi:hypothetical protein
VDRVVELRQELMAADTADAAGLRAQLERMQPFAVEVLPTEDGPAVDAAEALLAALRGVFARPGEEPGVVRWNEQCASLKRQLARAEKRRAHAAVIVTHAEGRARFGVKNMATRAQTDLTDMAEVVALLADMSRGRRHAAATATAP